MVLMYFEVSDSRSNYFSTWHVSLRVHPWFPRTSHISPSSINYSPTSVDVMLIPVFWFRSIYTFKLIPKIICNHINSGILGTKPLCFGMLTFRVDIIFGLWFKKKWLILTWFWYEATAEGLCFPKRAPSSSK